MEDFGHLQACLTGYGVAQFDSTCWNALLDGDEDVDADDMAIFLNCMDGPAIAADPQCAQ